MTRIALTLLLVACGSPATPDGGLDGGRDAGVDAGPRCERASGLPDPLVCNGSAALCDRPYDAVAYPTTHNAMSNAEERWVAPNQNVSMWQQLEDGVRGLMLDVYEDEGETLLCHGFCRLGSRPLTEALIELRTFMDCHPAEVLTIIFEPHVDEPLIAASFEAAGLLPYLHEQPLGASWPTLRAMIESGRRLVIFTETSDVSLPWYHHAYSYAWDNDYANRTPSDLDCEVNRGAGESSVFILNHFLTAPIAMRSLAEMINHNPFFIDQVRRCESETGQLPNFITVDFHDIGDLFEVVDAMNGL